MKTIAVGGHFLTYDTLPQSLLTRRLERLTKHVATNASHPVVDRLLSRMALAFTMMPSTKSVCTLSTSTQLALTLRFLVGKWHFAALFELVLLSSMLYPTSPDTDPESDKPDRQVTGKKRKHAEKHEVIPCPTPLTEVEWERLAALKVLRMAGQAVGCPVGSLCTLRWRSPAQQESLELPSLFELPIVSASDISATNKICYKSQKELFKWVQAVQVDIGDIV